MTPEELIEMAEKEKEALGAYRHRINVCVAAGCISSRSLEVREALAAEVKRLGREKDTQVKGVGCLGLCAAGPLVLIDSEDMIYQGVVPEDAPEIVAALGKGRVERLYCPTDAAFFARQKRIVLENFGKIDPDRIEDYISTGGYQTMIKALTEMTAQEILDEVERSGLRGRGGAGYPTGLKWSTVARNLNETKYVVCNADEGDPGAFMDRSALESDPHKIIEGMVIAAKAVGANHGFIYARAEYPLAVKRVKQAIRQAERLGLLGNRICETPFNFHLELRLGAGAFVCGEETALMSSIEGKRGQPRPRPPFPAESGLWEKPTLINNVETYANIPPIIRNGGDWFAAIGTEKSKGTKVFALAGRVQNTGLIEVPMGTKLREIIFDVGGGIPGGKKFKAVQTGGPSGGCIPDDHLDMSVDYESLAQAGSIMGSGGMIVMDETSCMVDIARYFVDFCQTESCGKCLPCRAGTVQMHGLLTKIVQGEAEMEDLAQLEDLCDLVANTSLCGLGQTAPNPVLSTLRYFRHEYLAHIQEKKCPAGVCRMNRAVEAKA